ncbi:hypothetical protein Q4577_22890 [Marinovum sp. 2_MG-2023]|uniref:hypothetical protein n=1 Tax=unclassified Marinovum TaxID=2647166 RepID=UPI0026E341D5|nr:MULTISPECIES: hypothetical protein [unclassified Marinovum]MDO6732865.1 hypothetical protein [Marinovum sp. 2_MG-2023]MDO6782143.1 hypothetical protein [Marinovum sp. 1_MG-2023]
MLQILNGIDAEAWAGIAGVLVGVGGAIAAVRKGVRKLPEDVGTVDANPPRLDDVLQEARRATGALARVGDRLEDIDRRTERTAADVRVLLDRR